MYFKDSVVKEKLETINASNRWNLYMLRDLRLDINKNIWCLDGLIEYYKHSVKMNNKDIRDLKKYKMFQ